MCTYLNALGSLILVVAPLPPSFSLLPLPHSLPPVEELAQQVQQATESLERCMELANRINSSLPERERLEHFHIRTTSEIERDSPER